MGEPLPRAGCRLKTALAGTSSGTAERVGGAMPSTPRADSLSELELDALWTIYEGHSLVIEFPQQAGTDPYANAIMNVAFEGEEAVAEVAEIALDVAQALIAAGLLERSEDGPVLDEASWYDDELGCTVKAEEYVLSDDGVTVIEATADGPAGSSGGDWDEDEDEDDDDDDWDDEDDEDEWDDEDEFDEDGEDDDEDEDED